MIDEIKLFLDKLNMEYLTLHTKYENYFWDSYMWDHSNDENYAKSQVELENRKSNEKYSQKISFFIEKIWNSDKNITDRLKQRQYFFSLNQIPDWLKSLKKEIIDYENNLQNKQANIKSWYIEPDSWKFIEVSRSKMSMMMLTEESEELRRACFEWIENIAKMFVKDLIRLVNKRNEFAKKLWYKNFYEYKTQTEERMSSNDIFKIFDKLYSKLSLKFDDIKKLEKEKMPNLRKPWNFSYMMAWDFTKQEDKYFPLETIIDKRWKSYTALNINYQWAIMKLDLLERKWKYDNWFCYQPIPTYFVNWEKQSWQTNFTCNAIYWQVGTWNKTWNTLFHEWGHAAHFSNMEQKDIILNTEYPPQSVAWAETQSMFLDTMFSSIDWAVRYATSLDWEKYPFGLYEKKVRKLHKISWRWMLSIASVVKFEEVLYNTKNEDLTEKFVLDLAKNIWLKYFDYSEPTLWILTVPHIYSWNSSAYYHWYWMAELWLAQIRKYFYETDWYIVDNPNVWKVLTKWRKFWSSLDYNWLLQIIIWQDLLPDVFIENVVKNEDEVIKIAKQRLRRLESVPFFEWKVDLNANVYLVDGKKEISNNIDMSWEEMNKKWIKYLNKNNDL